jgi:RNA polymerase sigma-70 factor (ECF subfamily)
MAQSSRRNSHSGNSFGDGDWGSEARYRRGSVDEQTRLLLAARDGDRIALAALIRTSQAEVWRLAARIVGRQEADDVTQDVFVRVYRALPAYRGDASARTWILAIARRTCADAIRVSVRRRRRDATLAPSESVAADAGESAIVDDLLRGLVPDRRLAFVLTQVIGCSYAEAAEICDVPVGTIRSRVARAREDLTLALATAAED